MTASPSSTRRCAWLAAPTSCAPSCSKGASRSDSRAELADPASVFAGLPGVEGWEAPPPGSYLLTVSDPDAAAPEVARALVHAGADILSITESRHSLEDVYLELVDEDVEAKRR